MQQISTSKITIYKDAPDGPRHGCIGNIPIKAIRYHDLDQLSTKILSVRFINNLGNYIMEFNADEVALGKLADLVGGIRNLSESIKLIIAYSGTEYTFKDRRIEEKFRKTFQYEPSKKNELTIEITTEIQ